MFLNALKNFVQRYLFEMNMELENTEDYQAFNWTEFHKIQIKALHWRFKNKYIYILFHVN